ncbi:MAG TPA: glycine--tRNA ligase, partial [Candidatus Wirthbacteria bacterium]|nr:glycine--tRNA ligase [Candidatus Wirthbacteria bacterium]
MDKIVSLCKRKGYIFQDSEIYNGLNGFWDFGPLGVELKNNIKRIWWRDIVHRREDVAGLDSSIINNPKVWEASGHINSFTDPLVDCRNCKQRFRADHLAEDQSIAESEIFEKGQCPACGKKELTEPKAFNLMFKTFVGPVEQDASVAYLRPETCQGIFINYNNIRQSSRLKLPFGIAQIGKAFRNEVNPRNFIFRSREFEQMELEWFCYPPRIEEQQSPDDWFEYWKKSRMEWHLKMGIQKDNLRYRDHEATELSHYAKAAVDVEYNFPFGGFKELEGIAYRTDFDLKQHSQVSGKDMQYFDEQSGQKFFAHVIEPSLGVDRMALALICDAYQEDEQEGQTRVYLKFSPAVAPVKAAVFPLTKDEKLVGMARKIYERLQEDYLVTYDESGSIGRRYRRQDEAGTPFCITVDFDSSEDQTVTIR